MSMKSHGGMILTGKPKNSEKNLTQCHFSTSYPTCTDPSVNLGLHVDMPVTNCLSDVTAYVLYSLVMCAIKQK
jgi:hypothetical protein